MVLLRKVIGDTLRARRQAQHRTLREVSTAANVSLGYLSEIERGHKEASSELLASICDALGAPLSQMLGEVSATFALAEQMEEAFAEAAIAQQRDDASTLRRGGLATAQRVATMVARPTAERSLENGRPVPVLSPGSDPLAGEPALVGASDGPDGSMASDEAERDLVTEGAVTVQVHSDGPLRTTLIAKRSAPDLRHIESLLVG
jgi:transcriptional regulator with XRE-family HTH domain